MDISASDLWFFGSGFIFGVSCGYGFAKILSKKAKKSSKEYEKLLKSQARELALARDKIARLESELAHGLRSCDEKSYKNLIDGLKTACDAKDKEIRALEKRLNSFRFSR